MEPSKEAGLRKQGLVNQHLAIRDGPCFQLNHADGCSYIEANDVCGQVEASKSKCFSRRYRRDELDQFELIDISRPSTS